MQLVKHRASGRRFAVKVLDKNRIVATRQVAHLRNERRVLMQLSHPFIVKVYRTLRDSANVYIFMEHVPGGELFEYIRRAKRFTEQQARYAAARWPAVAHATLTDVTTLAFTRPKLSRRSRTCTRSRSCTAI